MVRRQSKPQPTWTDVKAKLASFDRRQLLGLVQDLYAAHKDNQIFLHARFGLAENVLEPYRQTIDRWLWPLQTTLPASNRDALITRLDRVRCISQEFGYGVGDDIDFIFAKFTKRK